MTTAADPLKAFNDRLVAEFRATGGRPGGPFEGRQMLLLTTTGRRSGQPRTSPLAYSLDIDSNAYVVVASNRGADTRPAWLHNLRTDPDAIVEVGPRTIPVRAREVTDRARRDRLYAAHAALVPSFGDYEDATTRAIPVLLLEPVPGRG